MLRFLAIAAAVVAFTYGEEVSLPSVEDLLRLESPKPLFSAHGPPPHSSRIVGGITADKHGRPYQAALIIDNRYFCGGSLIADNWVLTAGHCANGAKNIIVGLGIYNITEPVETERQIFVSQEFVVHKNFSLSDIRNDVALVKLPMAASITESVKTVKLAAANEYIPDRTNVTASGWGKTKDDAQTISPLLMEVSVPTLPTASCKEAYGSLIYDGDFCTDGSGGHGTCNGDSGGPLTQGSAGSEEVVGIVSFGNIAGCDSGYPDGFTSVPYFRKWIDETMSNN